MHDFTLHDLQCFDAVVDAGGFQAAAQRLHRSHPAVFAAVARLERQLGLVPQEFNFNQFEKVFDIVVTQAGYYGIPAKIAKERAERYLTQLGLWDKRNEASRMLSGGMKRRLMIARALVHVPRLLILDEPLQGLDPLNRQLVRRFVDVLIGEGATQLLFVSHHAEDAPDCITHRLAFVSSGDGYTYQLDPL